MTDTDPFPIIHKNECKACKRCIIACPQNVLELSEGLNDNGYQYAEYKGKGCTGCRDCYYTCPEPLAVEIHSFKRKNNDIAMMIKYKTKMKESNNE
jgi:2-oxoisovalerate ferredoxin oxidoreductase delta subunit